MPAYLISTIEITDPAGYEEYRSWWRRHCSNTAANSWCAVETSTTWKDSGSARGGSAVRQRRAGQGVQ